MGATARGMTKDEVEMMRGSNGERLPCSRITCHRDQAVRRFLRSSKSGSAGLARTISLRPPPAGDSLQPP